MPLNFDFSTYQPGPLPAPWTGSWVLAARTRPGKNTSAVKAVDSPDYHVAFPGICQTQAGDLLVVYRAGLTHAAGNDPHDGRIELVRSRDGGATWGERTVLVDGDDWDDRNAAIACCPDGTLLVCWDKWGQGHHHGAWCIVSRDEGQTWTVPRKLEPVEDVHTRSRALALRDGRWLIPVAEGEGQGQAAYAALVDPATLASEMVPITPLGDANLSDEVCVARAVDDSLVALGRTFNDCFLWQTRSRDEGRTWEPPWLSPIPSAYAPADLITLADGRLLCAFSFRERRNERLVVSRDCGATWDIEGSLDVFDGTPPSMDRAYPATVQLDEHTVGTVLYQTNAYPEGGAIYFVRNDLRDLDQAPVTCLYQPDARAREARAHLPLPAPPQTVTVRYRFTGLFGAAPHRFEVGLGEADGTGLVFGYQMGDNARRRGSINVVDVHQTTPTDRYHVLEQTAFGDWFDDGLEHALTLTRTGQGYALSLDNLPQCEVATERAISQLWVSATGAAVAVYALEVT